VAQTGYPIAMDIKFKTNEPTFKDVLSLVPAVYTKDFESVQTSGSFTLDGMVKGTYVEKQNGELSIPFFDVNFKVNDARFQYPDLPKSVEDINIDLKVTNDGKALDATVIHLKQFAMQIAENPININMVVQRPITDPYIKGDIVASIDLASIADVIPMEEGEKYAGNISSDIHIDGQMSTIEEERYEDFEAEGELIVLGFDYASPELDYPVFIENLYMNFSPKYVELEKLNAKVGRSDFSANGRIDNMLAYYFREEQLSGTFNLNSNLLDINEFMVEDSTAVDTTEEPSETNEDTSAMAVVEVPGNINFIMQSKIKTIVYDNMEIKNFDGKVSVKDQGVYLDKVAMELLQGKMVMTGSYATTNISQPDIDFSMDSSNFDI